MTNDDDMPVQSKAWANSIGSRRSMDVHLEADNSKTNESQLEEATDSELDGFELEGTSWGDYPLDDLLIRHESRTIFEVVRRIDQGSYIMDPEFQRDFIWHPSKQSKLIESVAMRIPLPVFYLAEDNEGNMVVVDGLQRLSTFRNFLGDELPLVLPDRKELNGKRFSDLTNKLKNRIEDCNLTIYVIDSKVPERARLDIFERVNSGSPLTRQQMRNALFSGEATRFLRRESQSELFKQATGGGLNPRTMRDREFVNRFCAFQLLGFNQYHGDMDEYLAKCLNHMNKMCKENLDRLSEQFRLGLRNNFRLFDRHSFRRHQRNQPKRNVLNASLWDVLATMLSRFEEKYVVAHERDIRSVVYGLLEDETFVEAITLGTNDTRRVKIRFEMALDAFEEISGDNQN